MYMHTHHHYQRYTVLKSMLSRKQSNMNLKISTKYNKIQTLKEGKGQKQAIRPSEHAPWAEELMCGVGGLVSMYHLFPLNNKHRDSQQWQEGACFLNGDSCRCSILKKSITQLNKHSETAAAKQ